MAKKVTKKVRGSVQSIKSAGSTKKKVAKKTAKKVAKKTTKKTLTTKKVAKKVAKQKAKQAAETQKQINKGTNPKKPGQQPRMVAKKTGKKVAKKVRSKATQKNLENWRDAQAKANRAMRKAPKSIANRVATRGTSQPAKTTQPKTGVSKPRPSTPARTQPPRVEKPVSGQTIRDQRPRLTGPQQPKWSAAKAASRLAAPLAIAEMGRQWMNTGDELGAMQEPINYAPAGDSYNERVRAIQEANAYKSEAQKQEEIQRAFARAKAAISGPTVTQMTPQRLPDIQMEAPVQQNIVRDRYGNPVTSSDGSAIRTLDYDSMTQEEIDALFD